MRENEKNVGMRRRASSRFRTAVEGGWGAGVGLGAQREGEGTHRGSDTRGTNEKRGEMDEDKKRRRKRENRNERKGKKSLPKKDIADGIFFSPPKSRSVCLARLRKYAQFDIRELLL